MHSNAGWTKVLWRHWLPEHLDLGILKWTSEVDCLLLSQKGLDLEWCKLHKSDKNCYKNCWIEFSFWIEIINQDSMSVMGLSSPGMWTVEMWVFLCQHHFHMSRASMQRLTETAVSPMVTDNHIVYLKTGVSQIMLTSRKQLQTYKTGHQFL